MLSSRQRLRLLCVIHCRQCTGARESHHIFQMRINILRSRARLKCVLVLHLYSYSQWYTRHRHCMSSKQNRLLSASRRSETSYVFVFPFCSRWRQRQYLVLNDCVNAKVFYAKYYILLNVERIRCVCVWLCVLYENEYYIITYYTTLRRGNKFTTSCRSNGRRSC